MIYTNLIKHNFTPKELKAYYAIHCKYHTMRVMVFNATFNNTSVQSWQSAILVEETRVPGENHRPAVSHWQTLSHNVVSHTSRLNGIRTHNLVAIETDCIGSYKSNYHKITTMTANWIERGRMKIIKGK
jgi:hypothetical protein